MIVTINSHISFMTIKSHKFMDLPSIFQCFHRCPIHFAMISPWFPHDFPMIFLWFPHDFPMISPWFSHDFPWFPHDFPMISPWFPHDFPMISPWFSHDFPMISPWFPHDFPMIFPWFPHDFPMIFQPFPGSHGSGPAPGRSATARCRRAPARPGRRSAPRWASTPVPTGTAMPSGGGWRRSLATENFLSFFKDLPVN